MFKKILVSTDFSEFSQAALQYAAALSKTFGGVVECVHVVDLTFLNADGPSGVYVTPGDVERGTKSLFEHSRKELDRFVRMEHLLGVEVKTHLREGIAADEIVKLANEIHADLIVIPTHGRSGLDRMVFGSTCQRVLRIAPMSVLVLRAGEPVPVSKDLTLTLKQILCPIDFSEFSLSGLPIARTLAKQFGATLVLAHIVDTRFDYPEWTAAVATNNSAQLLAAAREHVGRVAKDITDVKTETHISVGVPARSLTELTGAGKADFVVMPTHGRKGIAHALLGSVTERVVRHAHCPVLTIRPKA